MVQGMQPGSVIVDLAAERGGNCELTRSEEIIERERRHHHRPHQPGQHRALSRQPDVRAQPHRLSAAAGEERAARPEPARRNHPRNVAHARRRNRATRACANSSSCRPWSLRPKEETVPSDFLSNLYVFILAGFVGFELIKRVSPLLHTPLMSLTNALDAIVVVAAIIIAGRHETRLSTILGADRRGRLLQQHGRRFLHHRSHAAHVQDRQAAQKVMSHDRHPAAHRLGLYRRHRSLHSVDQVAQLARHGAARRARRAKLPRRWPWAPRSPIPS